MMSKMQPKRDNRAHIVSKILENVPFNHFSPRKFQLDLLDTAAERNTIICGDTNVPPIFIALSLHKQFSFQHPSKSILIVTSDDEIYNLASTFSQNTGIETLVVTDSSVIEPSTLIAANAILMTPKCAMNLCCRDGSQNPPKFSISEHVYLLVVDECQLVLKTDHPYFTFFGPDGLGHFNANADDFDVDKVWQRGCSATSYGQFCLSDREASNFRILAVASSILPVDCTDPHAAKEHICRLEHRLNCRLETSSEIINLLALGCRPQEEVLSTLSSNPISAPTALVLRLLAEMKEFLDDVDLSGDVMPDGRGRLINVLSYCRRAVTQCEAIVQQLGVWCGCLIARVFLKHLLRLEHCRAAILKEDNSDSLEEHAEDLLTRLLRYTATQLAVIVRTFQTVTDKATTLEEIRSLASPRVLQLVDKLKPFKPGMNFRIEVSEAPFGSGDNGLGLPSYTVRDRSVGRRSRMGSKSSTRTSSPASSLSDSLSNLSSESDPVTTDFGSTTSLEEVSGHLQKRSSKQRRLSTTSIDSGASSFLGAGENSRLIYRAVPTTPPPGTSEVKRLCGLVLVGCQFSAYSLSRYIEELCSWDEDLFFVKAGHLFPCQNQSTRLNPDATTPNPLECGNGSILPASHEETIAEFRRGGSVNLLITTQTAGFGTELPRCNLVACLQSPRTHASYLASKAHLHLVSPSAQLLYCIDEDDSNASSANLIDNFRQIEDLLVQRCRSYSIFSSEHDISTEVADSKLISPLEKLLPSKAINAINLYCARLPSDFLTHLPPRWQMHQSTVAKQLPNEMGMSKITCGHESEKCLTREEIPVYRCELRLPMNAPIKTAISGDWLACKKLAKISAALKTLQVLQFEGEVDQRGQRNNQKKIASNIYDSFGVVPSSLYNLPKHRQSYFKKTPDNLSNCQPIEDVDGSVNFLFFIDIRLKISNSGEKHVSNSFQSGSNQGFGILTTKPIYHIPEFPIFSRAGEESVHLIEFWSPDGSTEVDELPRKSKPLNGDQLDLLTRFHRLVFQTVLRFEKDALVVFDVSKAYSNVLIVPTRRDTFDIDWTLVNLALDSYSSEISDCQLPPRTKPALLTISTASQQSPVLSPEKPSVSHLLTKPPPVKKPPLHIFDFIPEDFEDAVVTPAYRNLDRPPHYYVTKIRSDLSPLSDFPSKQFATFADYYTSKYQVKLTNTEQPLLDVEYTALRLCLIVPRNLNPRGTPLQIAEAKQDRLEDIRHKQLLIPELCYRHAFPASVWRKAVCLPSIIYRLYHLLLAEELREWIAMETGLGCPIPPPPHLGGSISVTGHHFNATEVFEPLRFIFPVEVTKFEQNLPTKMQPRKCKKKKKTSSKEGDKEKDDDQNVEKVGEDDNEDEEEEEEEKKDPTSVNLCLSPRKLSVSDPASDLTELLKETKVVNETEALISDAMESLTTEALAALNLSEDAKADCFIPIQNTTNADQEYFETASDVESVDSFEGNVVFFPSDDDEDSDLDDILGSSDQVVRLTSTSRDFKPGPASILYALTMSCANDFLNLERLETIGDSFLKFVISLHLYLTMPKTLEGRLSELRGKIVSNTNLFQLGRKKMLPEIMVGIKFEPHDTWIPPGYLYPFDSRQRRSVSPQPCLQQKVKIETFDPNAQEVLETKEATQCFIRIQQSIIDKSIADCVEALIGCYLTERGERSALKLIHWFGIYCIPPQDTMRRHGPPWQLSGYLDSLPKFDSSNEVVVRQAYLAAGFPQLEAKIGYRFKNPNLLLHAFTHLSYHQMNYRSDDQNSEFANTEGYQRLEFLGDAVLDYVITRFLYEDSQNHSPGVLTDLRSALVNNNIFAAFAVRIGLHRFLRASSPHLFRGIDAFVRFQKDVAKDDLDFITNEDIEERNTDGNLSTQVFSNTDFSKSTKEERTTANSSEGGGGGGGARTSDEVEIPKTLADIFESLAAAVFLDADLCLNTVWRVFYPLIKERVERYTACIPKSHVRQLFEREPDIVKFERPRRTADGRIRVCAHVVGKGKFYGVGRNYRLAKSLAAKRALRVLHNCSS